MRRVGLVLAAWIAIAFLFAGRTGAAETLRVDFLAVGQGDAALVTSPTGKTALIDGGPKSGQATLLAFLDARLAGPLDLVLLTHPHADHLGGLAAVMRGPGARLFLDAPMAHPSPAYSMLLQVIEQRRIPVRQAQPGRALDLGGGARLVLLTPPVPPLAGTRSDVNANGVVARLEYREVRILFAADAERTTEAWLLAQSGAQEALRAAVLKVAHHGGRYSSGAEFLAAVRPQVAIVSVGANNRYGHPAPATLARLAHAGARIHRTDVDGHITIETDGSRLDVRTAAGTPVSQR